MTLAILITFLLVSVVLYFQQEWRAGRRSLPWLVGMMALSWFFPVPMATAAGWHISIENMCVGSVLMAFIYATHTLLDYVPRKWRTPDELGATSIVLASSFAGGLGQVEWLVRTQSMGLTQAMEILTKPLAQSVLLNALLVLGMFSAIWVKRRDHKTALRA